MNNFIIKSDKTKDIDRSGYFENINIGFKSTIIDIPMFIFDAEGETTGINSFLVHKIDPITHEICNTITLDSTLIKLHANGYFYLDKTNLSVLFDVDAYYYLEISNGNKTWNSQVFQTLKIPVATFTINSFVANDYIQGLDTELSATLNLTATHKGLAKFNFTWNFGGQQVTASIGKEVSKGDTVILNPTASAPSGVTSGSYTLTVSGSVSGSDPFNYFIPIVVETNITDYTTQTSGITLTFTGNVIGKWIDQPNEFSFVSGIENTRTYTANGNYKLLIYGDLETITEISADNSRIVNIDFVTLNQITSINLSYNLLANLDLTNVPISGLFQGNSNSNLTSITFASSGNGLVNHFNTDNCDITGNLDLTNVPISGLFQGRNNPNLTSITFASSGNGLVTKFELANCDITGNLDLTNVPISGYFNIPSNSNLTSITFASSGNGLVNHFNTDNCDITGNLDLTNIPISGYFNIPSNSNLTSITFASSGNGLVTNFYFIGTNITGSLDLTNVPISGLFQGNSNSNLTSIAFASSGNGLTAINLPFCSNLISLDLTNVPISKIDTRDCILLNSILLKSTGNGQVGIFKVNNCDLPDIDITVLDTSNNISAEHQDNNFTITETDRQIQYYVNTGWSNGVLNVAGTNAAPSAAGLSNVSTLVSRGWTVNHN